MKCKLKQEITSKKSIQKIETKIAVDQKGLEIEQKYKKYLLRNDKEEILLKLQEDLLRRYKHITSIEVNIISNNIYDFACLTIGNASKDEISTYMICKNKYYSAQITNSLPDWQPKPLQLLEELKLLSKKYIDIMKIE